MNIEKFLSYKILNNSIQQYITVLSIFILSVIILYFIKKIIFKITNKQNQKSKSGIFTEKILNLFFRLIYIGIFYFCITSLNLNPTILKFIKIGLTAIFTVVAIIFATNFIENIVKSSYIKKTVSEKNETAINTIIPILKMIVWVIGIIFFLDNIGFEISTIVAGLGIGGVAVAFGAQAVLGDLFSYLAILFDKPFEPGDFIIVGDNYLGAIEKVGIKTTRIRSLGGEQVIFSNTDLTNSRIRNYKRMYKRRVVFKFGVEYSTPLEKLKQIPEIVKNIINNIEDTEFDRSHFYQYGDFSLNFENVYYIWSNDYNKYMDIQQEINFELKKKFEELKIVFAFPTQTLFVKK
jgi:small-conductance mechanosensitive channel